MNKNIIFVAILTLISNGIYAQSSTPTTSDWVDESPHEIHFVSVSPSVELEVLDWGGSPTAMPIIFLAGAANNVHVFDDFAPRFSDDFHVIGITRRGHGASSWPESGYDIPTLAQDIWSVLDDLNLQQVIFAGHSISGQELTRLATEHPDRVAGLIYIDAAYDHTKASSLQQVCASGMGPEMREQLLTRQKDPSLFTNTQLRVNDDGILLPYASLPIIPQFVAGLPPLNYSRVQAPALAIYYLPARIEDMILNPSDECVIEVQRYQYSGLAAFANGIQQPTIVTIPNSQHDLHLETPDELEAIIRVWLDKLSSE